MKKEKKTKTIVDARGNEYEAKVIDKSIVKRDTFVKKIANRAKKLNEQIAKEKAIMLKEVSEYLDSVASEYGEKWKGNALLISFDEQFKVDVSYHQRINFSEKLQIAKQKIDNCIKRWGKDTHANIQALLMDAFDVDKKGQISKSRILGLKKFAINDAEWKEAMSLIDESMHVTSTKQYIVVYERNNEGRFEQIVLNFSAIEVEG